MLLKEEKTTFQNDNLEGKYISGGKSLDEYVWYFRKGETGENYVTDNEYAAETYSVLYIDGNGKTLKFDAGSTAIALTAADFTEGKTLTLDFYTKAVKNEYIKGSVGANVSWSINKATQVLTVTCSGNMPSFSSTTAPWNYYKSYFNSIVIEDGCLKIGDYAFQNLSNVKSVTIPDSVTSIGNRAFDSCTNLENITIPDSVTSIGDWAFCWCKSLESITIPDSVTSIGYCAFYECSSLKSITIPDSVTSIDVGVFDYCTSLESVTLSAKINDIYSSTFNGCSALEEIILPYSIKYIGSYAFSDCSSLSKITIYNPNCNIDSSAIPISTTICGKKGSSVETFANDNGYFFEALPETHEHSYGSWVTSSGNICLGMSQYRICKICGVKDTISVEAEGHTIGEWTVVTEATCYSMGLKKAVCSVCETEIYEDIDTISHTDSNSNELCDVCGVSLSDKYLVAGKCGENVFWTVTPDGELRVYGTGNMVNSSKYTYWDEYLDVVNKIIIEEGVTSVFAYAFDDFDNVDEVTLPQSLKYIGKYAFSNLGAVTEITIPEGVETIGFGAFQNLKSLKNINFYAANASVQNRYYSDIFAGCGSDTSEITVVFGDKVTEIPAYLFELGSDSYAPYIKTVKLGKNVTAINEHAFDGCAFLETVVFNDSLETIGAYAFARCASLESMEISDGVTSIGENAFDGCNNLKSVYIPSSVETIPAKYDSPFCSTSSLIIIYCEASEEQSGWGYGWNYYNTVVYGASKTEYRYWVNLDKTAASIVIPDGITSIPAYAFSNFSSLESITIPDSVTSIGASAFYDCDNLKACYYEGTVAEWAQIEFGSKYSNPCYNDGCNLYINGEILTEIKSSDLEGVTEISYNAFNNCDSLSSVEFSSDVKEIGSYAFSGCDKLSVITIPDTVTSIGESATGSSIIACNSGSVAHKFAVDNKLQYALLDDETTWYYTGTVGNNLSWKLNKFTGILEIDCDGVIPDFAFFSNDYIQYIKGIKINDGCIGIGNSSFATCFFVETLEIPDSVKYIGNHAFDGCILLNAVIPASVESIGEGAFGMDISSAINLLYSVFSKLGTPNLEITIMNRNCDIDSSAFSITNAKIYGFTDSTAESYANEHGITFIAIDDEHTHEYDYDCDAICNTCNYEREVTHTPGEWATVTPATCIQPELQESTCSVCGDILTKELDTADHSFASKKVVAPTCTGMGYTVYECKVCKTLYTEDILAPVGHVDENSDNKCDSCGTAIAPKACDHKFELSYTEATCTEKGNVTMTCSLCGYSTSTDVAAKGHNYIDFTVEPGCTAEGYVRHYCVTCGYEYEDTRTPATGHNIRMQKITPTCTENGCDLYICAICGYNYFANEVAATGHKAAPAVMQNIVVSTCTAEGHYDSVILCSVCESELERTAVTTEETEHKIVVDNEVAPTCTQSGLTEGKHCSECGETITAQSAVPATGHSFTKYNYNNDATTEKDGTKTAKCDNCAITNTITAENTKLAPSNPTANTVLRAFSGTKSIKYKEKVCIKATADNLPSDCYIVIYEGNSERARSGKGVGSVEYTSGNLTGNTKYSVKIVDGSGKVMSSSSVTLEKTIEVKVDTGFGAKIAAFFKQIFGGLKTITINP